MKAYMAMIRTDIRLAARQKAVLFFNYLMPLTFFFVFAQAFHAEQGGAILQVLTMVIVIGMLGNGLLGAGMRAVQERENNILRRFKVAPISPLPLLVASSVTGLAVYMPCVLLMLFLAKVRYGMQIPSNLGSMLLFVMLGVIAMRSIGLIIASVANSMQESNVLVQIVYMTMLFLSGASFPVQLFPNWLLTVTQFIPATYLVTGLQGILIRHESLGDNWQAAGALVLTTCVGLLLCMKLFRWEKEEKIKPAGKLWVVAVLLPFFVLGAWQTHAKDNVHKTRVLERELNRSRTILIRNARIVVGDGTVIESGGILIRDGKIEEVYSSNIPDPSSLKAEAMEAAGKTILPGLIDMHVHLGQPGGVVEDYSKYDSARAAQRELGAYLYCGVTAVRSLGDMLDSALKTRELVNSGEKLGAELFLAGPLFTTAGGHGTEYFRALPQNTRQQMEGQFLRMPKTAAEARAQVDELKKAGVDAIKAIMEAGAGGVVFERLDPAILNAIGEQARADHLPLAVHTGDARDVEDALRAGASSIEHGSFQQRIPDADFALMAKNGVAYDPTLSVGEAIPQFVAGKTGLLSRSLVQQVVPAKILADTRKMLSSRKSGGNYPIDMDVAKDNLLRAWKAGVTLITGSDAGNMLVFHGPTVQHEIALWVEAGIPIPVAIQAATLNSARALGTDSRMGSIMKGKEASLLVVDGNPLQDVKALEAISFVMLRGERVSRGDLLNQD
ncbi:MAG: amidohydrolase family protein [Terriglobia bacterium]